MIIRDNVTFRFFFMVMISFFLFSCSGSGFHLRQSANLSGAYKKIALQGLSEDSKLYKAIAQAIEDVDGDIVEPSDADTILSFKKVRADRKVVAYNPDRVAREYSIFLYFKYGLKSRGKLLQERAINLDKTLIYDANVVLGKADEEERIRDALRQEAARLIRLRLQYSKT